VIDQGYIFTSKMVNGLEEDYKIKHRKSTPYHPQANGQVESTNKVIKGILTKTVHYIEKIGQKGFLKPYGPIELYGGTQWDIHPMNLFMGNKPCPL